MSLTLYEAPTIDIDALYELAMSRWCGDTIPEFAAWVIQECGEDISREVCKILYNFLLPHVRPEPGLINLIENGVNNTGCGLLPISVPH